MHSHPYGDAESCEVELTGRATGLGKDGVIDREGP